MSYNEGPACDRRPSCLPRRRGAVASEGLPGFMSEEMFDLVWGPPARVRLRRPNSAAAPDGASAPGERPWSHIPPAIGVSLVGLSARR